jgi:hypothetical protein
VEIGLATTLVPFVVLKAVVGVQVNEFAPFAVNVTVEPTHILADVTVIVGFGRTVIV